MNKMNICAISTLIVVDEKRTILFQSSWYQINVLSWFDDI